MSQDQGEAVQQDQGSDLNPQPSAAAAAATAGASDLSEEALQSTHDRALDSIRKFLSETTAYSILPESFRLIVLDNELTVKGALGAMTSNAVASAPLYDSSQLEFAGMLTYTDFIHLIQYYYKTAITYDNAAAELEELKLSSLREIEQAIKVPPPPKASIHPDNTLIDASRALVRTHARRIPLVDLDDATGNQTILSVLTQYRLLKFVAINCFHDCARLACSIGSLGIGTFTSSYQLSAGSAAASGSRRPRARSVAQTKATASSTPGEMTPTSTSSTSSPGLEGSSSAAVSEENPYHPIATATLDTTVFDVVHLFSELGISGVPIVAEDGTCVNLYETLDVVELVRQDAYSQLDLTIQEALSRRSRDFPGVVKCTPEDTLANVMTYIRERRVHRMVIVDSKDRLVGVLTLSDILRYLCGAYDLDPMKLVGLGMLREGEKTTDLQEPIRYLGLQPLSREEQERLHAEE